MMTKFVLGVMRGRDGVMEEGERMATRYCQKTLALGHFVGLGWLLSVRDEFERCSKRSDCKFVCNLSRLLTAKPKPVSVPCLSAQQTDTLVGLNGPARLASFFFSFSFSFAFSSFLLLLLLVAGVSVQGRELVVAARLVELVALPRFEFSCSIFLWLLQQLRVSS